MHSEYLDSYRLFGLKPGDGWTELRARYRQKIRACHPDRFPEGPERRQAEDRSKVLNEAYRRLAEYYRLHGRLPLDAVREKEATAGDTPADEPPPASRPETLFAGLWKNLRRPAILFPVVAVAVLAAYLGGPREELAISVVATPEVSAPSSLEAPRRAETIEDRYFTLGSTIGEVYATQGVPTTTEGDVWHYGTSRVYFRDGVVVRWEASVDHPLRVRGDLEPQGSAARGIRVGAGMAEVRAVQGDPLHATDQVWEYGLSRVYFNNGRVVGWSESPLNPLKIEQ